MRYHGYTYYIPEFLFPLWKYIFCKRGWHLWDEVYTVDDKGPINYLFCDVCYKTAYMRNEE